MRYSSTLLLIFSFIVNTRAETCTLSSEAYSATLSGSEYKSVTPTVNTQCPGGLTMGNLQGTTQCRLTAVGMSSTTDHQFELTNIINLRTQMIGYQHDMFPKGRTSADFGALEGADAASSRLKLPSHGPDEAKEGHRFIQSKVTLDVADTELQEYQDCRVVNLVSDLSKYTTFVPHKGVLGQCLDYSSGAGTWDYDPAVIPLSDCPTYDGSEWIEHSTQECSTTYINDELEGCTFPGVKGGDKQKKRPFKVPNDLGTSEKETYVSTSTGANGYAELNAQFRKEGTCTYTDGSDPVKGMTQDECEGHCSSYRHTSGTNSGKRVTSGECVSPLTWQDPAKVGTWSSDNEYSCAFIVQNNMYVGTLKIGVAFEKTANTVPAGGKVLTKVIVPLKITPGLNDPNFFTAAEKGYIDNSFQNSNLRDVTVSYDPACISPGGYLVRDRYANKSETRKTSGDTNNGVPCRDAQKFKNGVNYDDDDILDAAPSFSNSGSVSLRVTGVFLDTRYKVVSQSGVETLTESMGDFLLLKTGVSLHQDYMSFNDQEKDQMKQGEDGSINLKPIDFRYRKLSTSEVLHGEEAEINSQIGGAVYKDHSNKGAPLDANSAPQKQIYKSEVATWDTSGEYKAPGVSIDNTDIAEAYRCELSAKDQHGVLIGDPYHIGTAKGTRGACHAQYLLDHTFEFTFGDLPHFKPSYIACALCPNQLAIRGFLESDAANVRYQINTLATISVPNLPTSPNTIPLKPVTLNKRSAQFTLQPSLFYKLSSFFDVEVRQGSLLNQDGNAIVSLDDELLFDEFFTFSTKDAKQDTITKYCQEHTDCFNHANGVECDISINTTDPAGEDAGQYGTCSNVMQFVNVPSGSQRGDPDNCESLRKLKVHQLKTDTRQGFADLFDTECYIKVPGNYYGSTYDILYNNSQTGQIGEPTGAGATSANCNYLDTSDACQEVMAIKEVDQRKILITNPENDESTTLSLTERVKAQTSRVATTITMEIIKELPSVTIPLGLQHPATRNLNEQYITFRLKGDSGALKGYISTDKGKECARKDQYWKSTDDSTRKYKNVFEDPSTTTTTGNTWVPAHCSDNTGTYTTLETCEAATVASGNTYSASASCSDPAYSEENQCTSATVTATWTDTSSCSDGISQTSVACGDASLHTWTEANTCSNPNLAGQFACEEEKGQYGICVGYPLANTQQCEGYGATWEADTCSIPEHNNDQSACEAASVNTWTPSTCSDSSLTNSGETSCLNPKHTWTISGSCSDGSSADPTACDAATVSAGNTWGSGCSDGGADNEADCTTDPAGYTWDDAACSDGSADDESTCTGGASRRRLRGSPYLKKLRKMYLGSSGGSAYDSNKQGDEYYAITTASSAEDKIQAEYLNNKPFGTCSGSSGLNDAVLTHEQLNEDYCKKQGVNANRNGTAGSWEVPPGSSEGGQCRGGTYDAGTWTSLNNVPKLIKDSTAVLVTYRQCKEHNGDWQIVSVPDAVYTSSGLCTGVACGSDLDTQKRCGVGSTDNLVCDRLGYSAECEVGAVQEEVLFTTSRVNGEGKSHLIQSTGECTGTLDFQLEDTTANQEFAIYKTRIDCSRVSSDTLTDKVEIKYKYDTVLDLEQNTLSIDAEHSGNVFGDNAVGTCTNPPNVYTKSACTGMCRLGDNVADGAQAKDGESDVEQVECNSNDGTTRTWYNGLFTNTFSVDAFFGTCRDNNTIIDNNFNKPACNRASYEFLSDYNTTDKTGGTKLQLVDAASDNPVPNGLNTLIACAQPNGVSEIINTDVTPNTATYVVTYDLAMQYTRKTHTDAFDSDILYCDDQVFTATINRDTTASVTTAQIKAATLNRAIIVKDIGWVGNAQAGSGCEADFYRLEVLLQSMDSDSRLQVPVWLDSDLTKAMIDTAATAENPKSMNILASGMHTIVIDPGTVKAMPARTCADGLSQCPAGDEFVARGNTFKVRSACIQITECVDTEANAWFGYSTQFNTDMVIRGDFLEAPVDTQLKMVLNFYECPLQGDNADEATVTGELRVGLHTECTDPQNQGLGGDETRFYSQSIAQWNATQHLKAGVEPSPGESLEEIPGLIYDCTEAYPDDVVRIEAFTFATQDLCTEAESSATWTAEERNSYGFSNYQAACGLFEEEYESALEQEWQPEQVEVWIDRYDTSQGDRREISKTQICDCIDILGGSTNVDARTTNCKIQDANIANLDPFVVASGVTGTFKHYLSCGTWGNHTKDHRGVSIVDASSVLSDNGVGADTIVAEGNDLFKHQFPLMPLAEASADSFVVRYEVILKSNLNSRRRLRATQDLNTNHLKSSEVSTEGSSNGIKIKLYESAESETEVEPTPTSSEDTGAGEEGAGEEAAEPVSESSDSSDEEGMQWWAWLLIAAGVIGLLAVITFAFMKCGKRDSGSAEERKPLAESGAFQERFANLRY